MDAPPVNTAYPRAKEIWDLWNVDIQKVKKVWICFTDRKKCKWSTGETKSEKRINENARTIHSKYFVIMSKSIIIYWKPYLREKSKEKTTVRQNRDTDRSNHAGWTIKAMERLCQTSIHCKKLCLVGWLMVLMLITPESISDVVKRKTCGCLYHMLRK